jgi:hypothetical protein
MHAWIELVYTRALIYMTNPVDALLVASLVLELYLITRCIMHWIG